MTPRAGTVLAAALLLTSACSATSSSGSPRANPSPQQQLVNDGGTFDARNATTVQVTATNFSFSPSTILATPGQKLTLVVHNTSVTPHNISATSQRVNEDLAPGSTHTVTLTVPASGQLVFFCEYHAASGMAGRVGPARSGSSTPGHTTSPASKSGGAGGYGSY